MVSPIVNHLGESTLFLGASGVVLNFYSIFRAASHLGL